MKKLIVPVLALVLALSLAACGVDKRPAKDAYNAAKDAFTEFTAIINETPGIFEDSVIETMIEFELGLEEKKELLENGKDLTQEQLDEMILWYQSVVEFVTATKADYGIE